MGLSRLEDKRGQQLFASVMVPQVSRRLHSRCGLVLTGFHTAEVGQKEENCRSFYCAAPRCLVWNTIPRTNAPYRRPNTFRR